ncbi:hypothetical protein KIN20_015442 [Parelaphostrongylus tenuis]|uniref:Uncharacterized protein n=1 Tax=Parelaphostrongylus tenuis TaxID=148309 RepID=A0AAD5N0B9_PARTN|nr:hypothetical protein KIN20_015442 [Parelaphostrongylus tenuis]
MDAHVDKDGYHQEEVVRPRRASLRRKRVEPLPVPTGRVILWLLGESDPLQWSTARVKCLTRRCSLSGELIFSCGVPRE